MRKTGVRIDAVAEGGCVTAVRKALTDNPGQLSDARDRVGRIAGDLQQLQRRLACLHELSTRYSQVTFSDQVGGLVKMAGHRMLLEAC